MSTAFRQKKSHPTPETVLRLDVFKIRPIILINMIQKDTIKLHQTDLQMSLNTDLIDKIIQVIHRNKVSLTDEKMTQVQIATILTENNIPYIREYRLSGEDIVDFMVDDHLAVEIKIKGQKRAIYRQLQRYAAHDKIKGIVLLTGVSMGLPEQIDGKPAYMGSLSRGWL